MKAFPLLALLTLCGCKALLYAPEPHVVPLFEAPGQVQVAGGLSYDALSVQVAASPLPHVFLFADASFADREGYGQRYGEAGGGLYASLGRNASVEVLGGLGVGQTHGEGDRYLGVGSSGLPVYEPYAYEAATRRSFVQVNSGRHFRAGAVRLGASLRLAHVRFDDFTTDPSGLVSSLRGVFVEPAGVFRVRVSPSVDLEGQFGYSFPVRQDEDWSLFRRRGSHATAGVRFHLGR